MFIINSLDNSSFGSKILKEKNYLLIKKEEAKFACLDPSLMKQGIIRVSL